MDEEDWLISIGWQSDGTPFRTCLKLEEPATAGGAWPLRVVLQDRGDQNVQYEADPSVLKAWATAETDGEAAAGVPEAWRRHLGRAVRDAAKWRRMVPFLAEGEEGIRSLLTPDEAWELLVNGSIRLVEAGYSVFLPAWWERIRKWRPRLKAKIKSSVGTGPSRCSASIS